MRHGLNASQQLSVAAEPCALIHRPGIFKSWTWVSFHTFAALYTHTHMHITKTVKGTHTGLVIFSCRFRGGTFLDMWLLIIKCMQREFPTHRMHVVKYANYVGNCALWNFLCSRNDLYTSQDLCPEITCRQGLWPHGFWFAVYCVHCQLRGLQ